MGTSCPIEGCKRPRSPKGAHGLCQSHYMKWYRWGDPLYELPTDAERFWAKVSLGDGCWEYQGFRDSNGYGQFTYAGNRHGFAHRFAYEQMVGAIPEGLQIDHLCRNPGCARPEHLEPVTCAENVRRGIPFRDPVTHCKWGHPFDEKNTYYLKTGGRMCRQCNNRRQKETYARRREREGHPSERVPC